MRLRVLLTVVALAGAPACADHATPALVALAGEAMGSTWSVRIVPAHQLTAADRADLERGIADIVSRVDALMSTWDTDSELSRFNAVRSRERVHVAPETFEVFEHARDLAHQTDGAFDVTVGGLVEAWGFGAAASRAGPPPDAAHLDRLREAVGIDLVQLDPQRSWIRKGHPLVQCDFSGLAPGYAADRVARWLADRGLRDFLVDVGGEMVARGRNARGDAWQVAIEMPDASAPDTAVLARAVPLSGAAMATSGDYRNYREIDGVRLAHIIDPRTGRPIGHRLASATVITDTAVQADALATAMMVLGPDDGMALAERLHLAVLLLVRRDDGTFEQRRSSRMNVLLGGR